MNQKKATQGSKSNQANRPVDTLVIGDGWGALASVAFSLQKNPEAQVGWIAGTGARMLSATGGLETGPAIGVALSLAKALEMDLGEVTSGSFLREFRNKAFREPTWTKAPNPEMRSQVINEVLWASEKNLVLSSETRFTKTINEIEVEARAKFLGDSEEGTRWRARIRRIEGIPLAGFKIEGGKILGVILASGEEILASQVIYADLWSALPAVTGLPKNLPFIRGRNPISILHPMKPMSWNDH